MLDSEDAFELDVLGPPRAGTTLDDAAYVLYTSGSSGKPQGVMVPHRSAADFFRAMDARVGAAPVGTWLSVSRSCFDSSVLELLWTLVRGFRVAGAPALGCRGSALAREHPPHFLEVRSSPASSSSSMRRWLGGQPAARVGDLLRTRRPPPSVRMEAGHEGHGFALPLRDSRPGDAQEALRVQPRDRGLLLTGQVRPM
ncbi:hypothetical protein D7V80_07015 [Corallococcus sp. CA054B]|nr:hypothetical protein D7V80_07015 [Corallococcus sp. CA054B]